MKKELAAGGENFSDMIRNGCYYVDKTEFIKTVMESRSRVLLITRPRRFGKTLFMDTLKSFLQVDFDSPRDSSKNARLFSGLSVLKHSSFCQDFMGQRPTISLSLKGVEGSTYEKACHQLAAKLSSLASQYAFLLDSPRLDSRDKARLKQYLDLDKLQGLPLENGCKDFLKSLTIWLFQHFERQAVLLIDEYDVPLAKAAKSGYYDAMLELIRSFLGSVLKEDPKAGADAPAYLQKAVLTGCLRISKESLFTGINNLVINTVCSEDQTLGGAMGFSADEVQRLLQYYGLGMRYDDVRHWYDGYRMAGREIYCPWDVINFCDQAIRSGRPATFQPENYWEGTGSSDAIDEFLGFLTANDADLMQTLVDGGEIDLTINDKLTYSDFKHHEPRDFWTLLLHAGYLTVVKRLTPFNTYRVRIPNAEIRDSFINKVQSRYSSNNKEFVLHGQNFAKAALAGDCDAMAGVLTPLLRNYVSVRDAATKAPAENYYHGFLTALLSCAGSYADDLRSNVEAGDGFAGLIFTCGTGSRRIGVVIEIKRCAKPEDMYDCADAALEQIERKRYTAYLDRLRCGRKCAYGISFCRKDCAISGGVMT